MFKLIKSVVKAAAKTIHRISCGYTVHAYSKDLKAPVTHVAKTYKEALEWAACYATTDRVKISYEGLFGRKLLAIRG